MARHGTQPLYLLYPQGAGGLHQPEVNGGREVRLQPGGPKEIRHQGPVAGAQLDKPDRIGPTHLPPDLNHPEADQFTEDLADHGRGDEVAIGPDRRAHGIIAVAGVMQAKVHVLGHADRSGAPDPICEASGQAHGARSPGTRPRRISQAPKATMGRLRIMPMVTPIGKAGM